LIGLVIILLLFLVRINSLFLYLVFGPIYAFTNYPIFIAGLVFLFGLPVASINFYSKLKGLRGKNKHNISILECVKKISIEYPWYILIAVILYFV
ncbi:hypothetical protein ACFL1H_05625, partial [Nanoarchaeota archaeon]